MSLTTGLLAYWNLDAASGNESDQTGSGNTLTDNGSIASGSGLINTGRVFASASSQYFSNSLFPGMTAMSVSLWMKLSSISGGDGYRGVFSRDDGVRHQFTIYAKSNGTLAVYLTSVGVNYDGAGVLTFTTGSWYHVVATYDSVSGLIGYINASVDHSGSPNGNMDNVANVPINIGRDVGNSARYVDGTLDEIGVWSRALTSTEVSQLYNAGAGLAYPFGGGPSFLARSNPRLTQAVHRASTW